MDSASDPVVVIMGVGPKETKMKPQRHAYTPHVLAALLGVVKRWEQLKLPSMDE